MLSLLLPLSLPLFWLPQVRSQQGSFSLARNYSGSTFFDRWNFKSGNDLLDFWGQPGNFGNVNYLDKSTASSKNLTSVNSRGNVIIKVDDFTSGVGNPTYGRDSVEMWSQDMITNGSLIILDAEHLPFGCSVWPAFWTRGQGNQWPATGEIDIIENVNLATNNQYALHTTDGCTHPAAGTVPESGFLLADNCFVNATGQPHNQGCLLGDSKKSYGQPFAENGGGVFATLWDDDGIKIWFFERQEVPDDIMSASPNPKGWTAAPTANFPSSSCDTAKFFGPQSLVLDIDICGAFAGEPHVFASTCGSVAQQCTDIVQDPKNYHDAYFEIRYLTVYTLGDPSSSKSSSNGSGSQTSSKNSTGSDPSSNTGAAIGLVSVVPQLFVSVLAVLSASFFLL